jgi:hypothetical protein
MNGPMGFTTCAAFCLCAAIAQGAEVLLPSGVVAQHHDTIWDEDLSVIRMRFVVPRLAEPGSIYAADSLRVFEDMLWLCETQVTTEFAGDEAPQEMGWHSVVISLMDRPIEFGMRDAEVFQVFEGFVLTMDGCELELDLYDE